MFTEEQINRVVRAVADETARASYDMLENFFHRASRLSLNPQLAYGKTCKKTAGRGGYARSLSGARYPGSSSGECSDTSGALRTDEDLGSIGYSYEHSEHDVIIAPPQQSSFPSCSHQDLESPQGTFNADSPGVQTFASLKKEAMRDKQQRPRNQHGRYTASSSKGSVPRWKVSRSCKIMKEAYFKGMEWTRTFVSGPVDPRWNRYKFYCQICKANISIYAKGARETLRHHSSEKHLRKDQRWRYEYLYKVDPITKARIPQVRGKDGKLLTPYQLALELPKFKDPELVDIGTKLPFYEEYISGADYMSSSSENRARVQISVLARFLPHYGDIDVLRSFWRDIGVVVNHQSLFTDFNWTQERLTVSIYSMCRYFTISKYGPLCSLVITFFPST